MFIEANAVVSGKLRADPMKHFAHFTYQVKGYRWMAHTQLGWVIACPPMVLAVNHCMVDTRLTKTVFILFNGELLQRDVWFARPVVVDQVAGVRDCVVMDHDLT